MGNTVSRTAVESRLSKALPTSGFRSEMDRKRLIGCILAIASSNGRQDLDRHDFELVYTRRVNDRIAASIVAVREGVIEAKIDSVADGEDEAEAFKMLREEIERRMDGLLRDVPSVEKPPAYESSEREVLGTDKT